MQIMFLNFIIPAIIAVTFSFKKNDAAKSAIELLTQKTWILASYGYDDNRNGLIDAAEELILDCEKDNGYSFNTDGFGLYEDNSLSCGNGISEMPFLWKFSNADTKLDFLSGEAKIFMLDKKQLILYHDITDAGGQTVSYIQIFRH